MITQQRISVALCIYNGERYLEEQLISIATQRRMPDELIVVDDASTDSSRVIVTAFARQVPFPVYLIIHSVNQGSVVSFEHAISACAGEIIALADQDDRWHVEKLRVIERTMEDPTVGMVFSDASLVDAQMRPLGQTLWKNIAFSPVEQRRFVNGAGFEVLLYHNVVTGATAAFRTSFRPLVLPFPKLDRALWTHDGWIALLVSACAYLVPIAIPLIEYRQHPLQQIGAAQLQPRSLGTEIALARQRRCTGFSGQLHHYAAAYKRLVVSNLPVDPHKLQLLADKIAFLRARMMLPAHRIERLEPIWRHMLLHSYRRYAAGLRSIAADLFL